MNYPEIEKDRASGVAIMWFDQPGEKINKLSIDIGESFSKALDEFEKDPEIKGVVLISRKKDCFIAGADIHQFLEVTNCREGEALSRQAHAFFDRVEKFPKPVVAAIHGTCMGGGTEMSLACHYRIATDDPKTCIALPEVKLGLLPGAGGTQRLSRLVPLRHAMDIMLTGKNIYCKKAKSIGLVDEVVAPSVLLDTAKKAALKLSAGPICRKKKLALIDFLLESCGLGRKIAYRAARKRVMKETGGHYPAPLKIIECVEAGIEKGKASGFEAEAKKFGELIVTTECRNLIQIFFNMTAHKKNPGEEKARNVQKIGIVGTGTMGTALAHLCASKELEVWVKGRSDRALEESRLKIVRDLEEEIRKGILPSEQRDGLLSRIRWTKDYSGFDRLDLVIENVVEELSVKRQVLAETEAHIGDECVYASDTSSLPISQIAAFARRPERVLGMHYFSPVKKMPLLEIVVTEKNDEASVATAYRLGSIQGKTMLQVKDGPGFYTTRILAPYLDEAMVLLEEGGDISSIDKAMREFGFPTGPFSLLDEIGLDVAGHVSGAMRDKFEQRGFSPSDLLARLASEGFLGRKNRKGFYEYGVFKSQGKKISRLVYALTGGSRRRKIETEEIQDRLFFAMINEATFCLQEGILGSAEDGDLGAVFALGFPPFLGGPFRYIAEKRKEEISQKLNSLSKKWGEKFTPSPYFTA